MNYEFNNNLYISSLSSLIYNNNNSIINYEMNNNLYIMSLSSLIYYNNNNIMNYEMNNNLYITGLSSTINYNYNTLTNNFNNYVTISSFYINIGYNYLFQTSISSILYTNYVTNHVVAGFPHEGRLPSKTWRTSNLQEDRRSPRIFVLKSHPASLVRLGWTVDS